MYQYAQLKRFHHNFHLQVYMCDFMYVYPDTMPVEDHFTATKTFVVNYKKMSTQGPVPKHWLGQSYIRSEDYYSDQNFYDTELKKQSDNTSNDRVLKTRKTVVIIEEDWFGDMKLTDGATFPTALIKRAKLIFNQKMKIPRDTEQHTQEISTNNGWNTQVIQILREEPGGKCLFKVNMISRPQKPV